MKKNIWQSIEGNNKYLFVCFILLITFFCLYSTFGLSLAQTSAFSEYDILFEADLPRTIANFSDFKGDEHRSKVHPVFLLMVNPVGSLLNQIFQSETSVAIMLNSFFGSVGVVLAFTLFRLICRNSINAFLLTLIYALSMAHLFFSSVPETVSLAICSLLTMYILFFVCLSEKRLFFKAWVFVGILTFGVTITNFVQTMICFTILILFIFQDKKLWWKSSKIMIFFSAVIFATVFLALLQKFIYPASSLFFTPQGW